jgi:hypothetical protein
MNSHLLFLGLVVFSVGCGKTESPSAGSPQSSSAQPVAKPDAPRAPSAAKRDPCSLLTKEEVTSALGANVTDAHSDDGMHCMYSPQYEPGNGGVVTLAIGPENIKMFFTESKRVLSETSGNGYQEIAGIGDGAFTVRGGELSVRKGDAYFAIGLTTRASFEAGTNEQVLEKIYADLLEKKKALAIKALARL